jgi:hypothetical protein
MAVKFYNTGPRRHGSFDDARELRQKWKNFADGKLGSPCFWRENINFFAWTNFS